jgi:hypothetical protein
MRSTIRHTTLALQLLHARFCSVLASSLPLCSRGNAPVGSRSHGSGNKRFLSMFQAGDGYLLSVPQLETLNTVTCL